MYLCIDFTASVDVRTMYNVHPYISIYASLFTTHNIRIVQYRHPYYVSDIVCKHGCYECAFQAYIDL
jgi:hypothetical protein